MVNGERYGVKSDLWAMGVVSYEMSTLRVPFYAHGLPAVAMKIVGAEPEPMSSAYPATLHQLVGGLLQKNPDDRPPLKTIHNSAYFGSWAEDLLAHSRKTGTGGCEGIVKKFGSSGGLPAQEQRASLSRDASGGEKA